MATKKQAPAKEAAKRVGAKSSKDVGAAAANTPRLTSALIPPQGSIDRTSVPKGILNSKKGGAKKI